MKKKENKEIAEGEVIFLGTAPDSEKKRRRRRIVAAAAAAVAIAGVFFLLGRSSNAEFNPDLTVLPKKVVERMVSPMLDSLVRENFSVTETQKATILRPTAKQVPVRIASCTVTGLDVTYRFESTESYGSYGTIQGELTLCGSPTTWDGKPGFLTDARGNAIIGSGAVKKGSSSVKRLTEDIMKRIPIDGEETELPSGNIANAAIGRNAAGEYFVVQSNKSTTYSNLSDVLKTAGAEYAIFLNGHIAYNWHIEDKGIVLEFASYTEQKPKGMNLVLW